MRVIIGQAQRETILKAIRPGFRVLEWGSGGSTLWFADRLPPGATLTSIDHDVVWNQRVQKAVGGRANVTLLVKPPTTALDPSANATPNEERPDLLQEYIHAVDGQKFDVILVDGYARVACLEHARTLLKPGGVVFLHDAQRPWYDQGKMLYIEHGTVGSCPDYPGPLLWWGGLETEAPRYSMAALPMVVCFYTVDTPYEEEVKGLRDSCVALGLDHHLEGVKALGQWEANCAFKSRFIREVSKRFDRPVLWCDADAKIHRPPMILAGCEPDFAIHKCHRWQFASGTVFFNRTEPAQQLIEYWVEQCEKNPHVWDQISLDSAWERLTATRPLKTTWLPQAYTKIYDLPWEERLAESDRVAVIEHFQASRRFRKAVSTEKKRRVRLPTDTLSISRMGCRPRPQYYTERFTLASPLAEPEEWKELENSPDDAPV